MALYVASHYKNSPNDLQLLSDAPAHQLYVLVPPLEDDAKSLPEPLCVVQVALEGQISRESVMSSLSRGQRASGDLIPWLVSQQFQDEEFAGLSGARIVRIATNPEYISMGYGTRALQLLTDFYEGKFTDLAENEAKEPEEMVRVTDAELEDSSLLQDNVKVRDVKNMPPLFGRLSERKPPLLDYVGVSYGLTLPLHKFWNRGGFVPVYLRQTPNDLTGEHTSVMIRALGGEEADSSWLGAFARDFHRRFLNLLSYQFRAFPSQTSLNIDASASAGSALDTSTPPRPLTKPELDELFSPFDLKRLDKYSDQMLDYHVIMDMLPTIATLYFSGRLKPAVSLSRIQQLILLAVGLQRKAIEDMEKELPVASSQILGLFVKIMRKISTHFRSLIEEAVADTLPDTPEAQDTNGAHFANGDAASRFKPLDQGLDEDLAEGAADIDEAERERIRNMIDANLDR